MNFMQDKMKIMKILCNSKRFAIISLLSEIKGGLRVNEISTKVGISQSLASHQLSHLETSGVVVSERMGQSVCYMLSSAPIVKKLIKVINILG